ncbi:hypothetical protein DAEQUDRAFT_731919 [Daedalea quercina L-15889]|uniref:Uncharacterized protein n=1 Tax=Daedalea quercina L-15889 TaxID=1314783 RepID=A0A165LZP6_9APHY|nr:hypothetical protein DAEQUDRAFT_731919 [Daedalea quercina L-15889]
MSYIPVLRGRGECSGDASTPRSSTRSSVTDSVCLSFRSRLVSASPHPQFLGLPRLPSDCYTEVRPGISRSRPLTYVPASASLRRVGLAALSCLSLLVEGLPS